jgi:elongation factor Ts
MKIALDRIKKLRQQTGSGIMDCRQALQQARGDFAKAKNWLKEKGLARAAKKKDRETKVGFIEAYIHNNSQVGAMVKLSCETDFVSHTQEFKELAHEIAMQVAAMNPKTIKDLLSQVYIRDPKKKIDDLIKEAMAKLGENIKIEKVSRLSF